MLKKSVFNIIFMLVSAMVLAATPSTAATSDPDSQRLSEQEELDLLERGDVILDDLDRLLHSRPGKNLVTDIVGVVAEKFRQGELTIAINPGMKSDIYEGAQFHFSTDGPPYKPTVAFSPFMIRLYEKTPSIVLSALVHELQHAWAFFNDQTHFVGMTNVDLERYLYEMDALHVEAVFIITYLQPDSSLKLTGFEEFLARSYQKDNLGSFSFYCMGFDMRLAYALYGICRDKMPTGKKSEEVTRIINLVLASPVRDLGDEKKNYSQMVPLYTLVKFVPQIMCYIDHDNKSFEGEYDFASSQPEIHSLVLEAQKRFLENIKYFGLLEKTLDELGIDESYPAAP